MDATSNTPEPYVYHATVTRVIDGDTAEVVIDLGFGVSFATTARFLGVNAPEMKGPTKPAATISRDRVKALIEGKAVTVQSHEVDSFRRCLSTIWVDGLNVSDWLLKEGLAVPFKKK